MHAASIHIAGARGLAHFGDDGSLSASSSLRLNADGSLLISDISNAVNLHGNAIDNAVLRNVTVHSSTAAFFDALTLKSTRSVLQTALDGTSVFLGAAKKDSGEFSVLPSTVLHIRTPADGSKSSGEPYLSVSALAVRTLVADVDASGFVVKNAKISGGSISGVKELAVTSLDTASLTLSKLSFSDVGGELDFKNRVLSNARLDMSSVTFGGSDGGAGGVGDSGRIPALDIVSLTTDTVVTKKGLLLLGVPPSTALLATDSDGRVVSAANTSTGAVQISASLAVTGAMEVTGALTAASISATELFLDAGE